MSVEERRECLELVREAHASGASKVLACELIGIDVRTLERWATKPEDLRRGPLTAPLNALTAVERATVLRYANSEEYANLLPGQIVPKLADLGIYVGSESTFYRVLKADGVLAHRSRAMPRKHAMPAPLMATAPNQIWSWDITYLKAEIKSICYYLYLPMDVFSRAIVHWELHPMENAELASEMIKAACEKQNIKLQQITLHSDNSGPMKGATMRATLDRLGITPSLSRPKVSDDHPFSEALFKTLKYCPSYPLSGRFESIETVREWVGKFVSWYNEVHLHSGINWVTPASRHQLHDEKILTNRRAVYEAARMRNPNRWSEQRRDWSRQNVVELNPGKSPKVNKIDARQKAS